MDIQIKANDPSEDLETLLSFLSHDLKSPLRSICGFSAMILENGSESVNTSSIDHVKRIEKAAHRMEGLIEGMLTYVRFGQRKLDIKELNISKICANILDQKNYSNLVDVVVKPNMRAHGDEVLINVLLENLIQNAIKFTKNSPSGRIDIDFVETPQGKAFLVKDNGIGFHMEHARHLFKPFELVHSDPKLNGIGMGLPIAKRIVDRHGGSIWFESAPNEGTRIYFTLLKKSF